MKAGGFPSLSLRALVMALIMLGLFAVTGFPEPIGRQLFIAVGTAVITQIAMAFYYSRRSSGNSTSTGAAIKLGVFPSRAFMALIMATSLLGLFAVTGFPEPIGRQVFIAVGAAVIVQVAMAFYYSRRGSGHS